MSDSSTALSPVAAIISRGKSWLIALIMIGLVGAACEFGFLLLLHDVVADVLGEDRTDSRIALLGVTGQSLRVLFLICICGALSFELVGRLVGHFGALTVRSGFHREMMQRLLGLHRLDRVKAKHEELMWLVIHAPSRAGTVLQAIGQLVVSSVRLVAVLVAVTTASFMSGVVVTAIGLLFWVFIEYGVAGAVRKQGEMKIDSLRQMNGLTHAMLDGFREIRLYGHVGEWSRSFFAMGARLADTVSRSILYGRLPGHALTVLSIIGFSVAVVMTRPDDTTNEATLSIAVVILVALQRALPSLKDMSRYRMVISENLPVVASLVGVPGSNESDRVASDRVASDRVPSDRASGCPVPTVSRSIDLRDVGVEIEGAQLLTGVTITLDAGTTTAIIGPSGAGKSTCLSVIAGLLDPTHGSIEADGVDLQSMNLDQWQETVALVPQETFLIEGNVFENINMGRGASEQAIMDASRAAGVHPFVVDLPQGYDTRVGDRGFALSGGERQRIGIARALLGNPAVLLLDEATSSLDRQTELEVERTIAEVTRGRTVVTVTHRPEMVDRADQVIELSGGSITWSTRCEPAGPSPQPDANHG